LEAFSYIKENAIDWSVAYFDEKQIDEINILSATLGAMHKALDNLQVRPEMILVDGSCFNPYTFKNKKVSHVCIEKGDDTYSSIAAASILAKVSHDKYIDNLCEEHEELDKFYGLSSNKGYGTAQHLAGIKQHGISKWHRKTFGRSGL